MRKKSLVIIVTKSFPFIVSIGLKEQWDLEVKPFVCIFHEQENRCDRIFEF